MCCVCYIMRLKHTSSGCILFYDTKLTLLFYFQCLKTESSNLNIYITRKLKSCYLKYVIFPNILSNQNRLQKMDSSDRLHTTYISLNSGPHQKEGGTGLALMMDGQMFRKGLAHPRFSTCHGKERDPETQESCCQFGLTILCQFDRLSDSKIA